MRRGRERGDDAGIGLRWPDEPVLVLGLEAANQRVERGGAHEEHDPRGLGVAATVGDDQLAGDRHIGRLRAGRLVHVPVQGDRELLGRAGVGDLPDLGERRREPGRPERGRGPGPEFVG
jgi:hypothetical protein